MKRPVIRKENFGALLFDPNEQTLKNLTPKVYNEFLLTETNIRSVSIDNKGFSSLASPIKVFLGLTEKCNLQCVHCSMDANNKGGHELLYEEIAKILKQLNELGIFMIGLNGAEPLCHPDFFRVLKLINEYGFLLTINTNGAFGLDIMEKLANSKVDLIKVSVDGLEKTHDSIRGNGVYKKVIRNIKYLKEKGCNVSINFTMSNRNKTDLFELIKLSLSLGCKIKIAPMISVGRAIAINDEVIPINEKRDIYNRICKLYKVNKPDSFVHITENFVYEYCLDIIQYFNYQYTACGNRRVHMSINCDGSVYTTGRQTDFIKTNCNCNVKSESILSIWNKIKLYNEKMLVNNPECKNCDINKLLYNSFNNLTLS